MMVRGVNPQFAKFAISKSDRVDFNIQVIDHTAERHKNQIQKKHVNMYWNYY